MKKLLFFIFSAGSILPVATARALPGWLPPTCLYLYQPASGATSLAEISNALLLSLQTNKPDQLTSYFLTDKEITYLRQLGSEDMNAVLENKSVTDLQNNFATDLQKIVQEGMAKTVNWSETIVTDTKTGNGASKNSLLFLVETVLQTKQDQALSLQYEVVKIRERFYLFRGIQLKS